jgi:hypothetical protein
MARAVCEVTRASALRVLPVSPSLLVAAATSLGARAPLRSPPALAPDLLTTRTTEDLITVVGMAVRPVIVTQADSATFDRLAAR